VRVRRSVGEECLSPTSAELIKADQEHLIRLLHHPVDNAQTRIYVRGHGVTVQDIEDEYLDGLSGLWNVNVGHGRAELAETAAAQMKELAYLSRLRRLVEHPIHHLGRTPPGPHRPHHAGRNLDLGVPRVRRVRDVHDRQ